MANGSDLRVNSKRKYSFFFFFFSFVLHFNNGSLVSRAHCIADGRTSVCVLAVSGAGNSNAFHDKKY